MRKSLACHLNSITSTSIPPNHCPLGNLHLYLNPSKLMSTMAFSKWQPTCLCQGGVKAPAFFQAASIHPTFLGVLGSYSRAYGLSIAGSSKPGSGRFMVKPRQYLLKRHVPLLPLSNPLYTVTTLLTLNNAS